MATSEVVAFDALAQKALIQATKPGEVIPPPVDGFIKGDKVIWRWVISAYRAFWNRHNIFPNNPVHYTELRSIGPDWNDAKYAELEAMLEFQKAMLAAGVAQPSVKQDFRKVQALEVLTAPGSKLSLDGRLKKIGVDRRTYEAWMSDPEFCNALTQLSERNFGKLQYEVNNTVQKLALSGRLDAVKYFNELSGRTSEKQGADVQVILRGVVDIITRNIHDAETLKQIAAELQLLVSAQTG